MTDEEYLFRQTERERKRTARGDFNKKRQGGRHVRLPSDNLKRKDWEKMNGECRTYDMTKPVKWKEFRAWPEDLQREYILGMERTFHASSEDMAKKMGCGASTLRNYRKEIGCAAPRGGAKRSALEVEAWNAFWGFDAKKIHEAHASAEKCVDSTEKSVEKCDEFPSDPSEKQDDIPDGLDEKIVELAMLMQAVRGTGAKVTIEVVL